MRPSTRSKVLRLRGAGEGEGEGGGKDGYTIVQDGNGDFVIGGVDATVGVHGGGEENLVNTKIGEEGRMGIMCVDVGCQNTVAAMRYSTPPASSPMPSQPLPCRAPSPPILLCNLLIAISSVCEHSWVPCLQELARRRGVCRRAGGRVCSAGAERHVAA